MFSLGACHIPRPLPASVVPHRAPRACCWAHPNLPPRPPQNDPACMYVCMYVTRRAAGAVVLNMGVLRADRNFVAPTRLHSVGFKGQWTYRPVASSPEAAAAGSPKSLPVFECEVAADGSLPQYSVYMKVRDDQSYAAWHGCKRAASRVAACGPATCKAHAVWVRAPGMRAVLGLPQSGVRACKVWSGRQRCVPLGA